MSLDDCSHLTTQLIPGTVLYLQNVLKALRIKRFTYILITSKLR